LPPGLLGGLPPSVPNPAIRPAFSTELHVVSWNVAAWSTGLWLPPLRLMPPSLTVFTTFPHSFNPDPTVALLIGHMAGSPQN
jgi:hypothetical protein